MPRSLWKGFVSFGLVAIPVSIVPVEEKHDIRFHLLDVRDKSRIRYQRVNSETGKEVSWDNIVRGYEIDKNQYVVMNDEDFQKARPETYKSIDINEFVDLKDIDNLYFDKPYYLIPEGKNKKAYVLLREALKKSAKVGVGKVIIRTKEYLSLIFPHDHALVLYLIHYQEEIRDEVDLPLPEDPLKTYHITPGEMKMAMDLVSQMANKWNPGKYHDDYHEALKDWIEKKSKTRAPSLTRQISPKKDDVIDFVTLLKKSMEKKGDAGKRAVKAKKQKSR